MSRFLACTYTFEGKDVWKIDMGCFSLVSSACWPLYRKLWSQRCGLDSILVMCSKKYNFDPTLPEERRRLVLTMCPVHWAAEWLRPILPNFKMVGPVLAGPGKPLPTHLEVLSPMLSYDTVLRLMSVLTELVCMSSWCMLPWSI